MLSALDGPFFSNHVINYCNSLSSDIVAFSSASSAKVKINMWYTGISYFTADVSLTSFCVISIGPCQSSLFCRWDLLAFYFVVSNWLSICVHFYLSANKSDLI